MIVTPTLADEIVSIVAKINLSDDHTLFFDEDDIQIDFTTRGSKSGTAFCAEEQTEFFFLSFPLLLCLKLVRSGRLSPPWPTMVLVRHFIRGHHYVCRCTLRTLSPLIRL